MSYHGDMPQLEVKQIHNVTWFTINPASYCSIGYVSLCEFCPNNLRTVVG